MTENQDCPICLKQQDQPAPPGGPIYADEILYVCHALLGQSGEQYLGWLTVETRRHAPGLADLTDAEAQAAGLLAARLSRLLKSLTGAEHIYAFVIGHGVAHFHLHLLPRYPGTPREFWGLRVNEWPAAPRGAAGEIKALCDRLRKELS